MINPYSPYPGHRDAPLVPVVLDGQTYCVCDQCHEARQRWADQQPPLAEELENKDSDDLPS